MNQHLVTVRVAVKNTKARAELEKCVSAIRDLQLQNSVGSKGCNILIHEIGEEPGKDFQLIRDLRESGMVDEVFLTSPHTDPEILIQALRSGAKEFISQPIKPEEVTQILQTALERKQEEQRRDKRGKRGVIIDVIGSKGGVGTTTTAVNLAVSLRELKDVRSVALIDMNLLFGEIPLFLDLQPVFSWGEIVSNASRLDMSYLMGVLTKHPTGIHVLPPPTQLNGESAEYPKVIEKILRLMQQEFDYIIIDGGQTLDALSLKILELSDVVLMISILALPCLMNLKKLLETFRSLGYPEEERIQIVMNRYHKKSIINRKDAEKGIQKKISWLVPNDYQATISAINQGKSLSVVAQRAEITRNYRELAMSLAAQAAKRAKQKGAASSSKVSVG